MLNFNYLLNQETESSLYYQIIILFLIMVRNIWWYHLFFKILID